MASRATISRSIGATEGQNLIETPGDPDHTQETVEFLGRELSVRQYREACNNLRDFFAILRTWAKDEKKDEEEAQS
ncbi:MAG: hypothetical protein OEV49_17380 [candidate division Zixibacteria bacterium]|nr:hypothetical protein [candidate division Zixibacteria bacterium]MDH3938943.1 hypothetical protein [candidate division Zixibacteria bacterium]MDH4032603.1 hypothetical protein [candidate division Zixibacteria bacterium]